MQTQFLRYVLVQELKRCVDRLCIHFAFHTRAIFRVGVWVPIPVSSFFHTFINFCCMHFSSPTYVGHIYRFIWVIYGHILRGRVFVVIFGEIEAQAEFTCFSWVICDGLRGYLCYFYSTHRTQSLDRSFCDCRLVALRFGGHFLSLLT